MLLLKSVRQTMRGVYEIVPERGSAFFLRSLYLPSVIEERLLLALQNSLSLLTTEDARITFSDEEALDIYNAAAVYATEQRAMAYLARAEQCRFGLTQKLLKKQFSKANISKALDYLEGEGFLSDERFAGAWLRNRSIDHTEGKAKLTAELCMRGISKTISKKAVDDFFLEHDEYALCERAYSKYVRVHTSIKEENVYATLQRQGFSHKMIKAVIG